MNASLRRKAVPAAAAVALCLTASACSKAASSSTKTPAAASANAQQVVASAAGAACTSAAYAGGVPTLNITDGETIVGFSQSESTSNPFRATETKTIEDEASRASASS